MKNFKELDNKKKLAGFSSCLPGFQGYREGTLEELILQRELGIDDDQGNPEKELEPGEWDAAAKKIALEYYNIWMYVCRDWISEHNVEIVFEKLQSPEFYNYVSDEIWITVKGFRNEDEFLNSWESWKKKFCEDENEAFGVIMYHDMME